VNTLKMLLVFAVLGGVGYGVYQKLNSRPDSLPPGVPETWGKAPTVQMPGEPSAMGGTGLLATGAPPGFTPGPPLNPGGPDNPPPFDPSHPAADAAGSQPYQNRAAPPYPSTQQYPPAGQNREAFDSGPGLQPPLPGAPPAVQTMPGNPYASEREAPAGDPDRPGVSRHSPETDFAHGIPENLRTAAADLQGAAAQLRTAAVADLKGAGEVAASSTFTVMMEAARHELEAGRLAEVHRQLSAWYDDPRLSSFEQQRLTELLDQLAGTLVYSTQSLLEPEHEVQPGERLEDIGQRVNVPWQLLAKVNGIDDPQSLRPGERLKVVKGPFTAVVSLQKRQLTLMLGGMYAGRFPIGLGREHPAVEGTYVVTDKVPNPTYYGADRAIEPEDPSNPLGKRWIGLGNQLGIHGTNDPKNVGRTDLQGCISLSPRDAEDVFDILSVGSKVIIRR
jgi:LysM repeat protein